MNIWESTSVNVETGASRQRSISLPRPGSARDNPITRPEEHQVGFLSRTFIPRGARRAAHPGRAVRRAVTPRAVKRAQRAMHPVDNAVYGVQRKLNTKRRKPRKKV